MSRNGSLPWRAALFAHAGNTSRVPAPRAAWSRTTEQGVSMSSSQSSTTSTGEQGTGTGDHNRRTWPHYGPPRNGNSRVIHTEFDFDAATVAIRAHSNQRGQVTLPVTVWRRTVTAVCSICPAQGATIGTTRCMRPGGAHNTSNRQAWASTPGRDVLYFNKTGHIWKVSMHPNP